MQKLCQLLTFEVNYILKTIFRNLLLLLGAALLGELKWLHFMNAIDLIIKHDTHVKPSLDPQLEHPFGIPTPRFRSIRILSIAHVLQLSTYLRKIFAKTVLHQFA